MTRHLLDEVSEATSVGLFINKLTRFYNLDP